MGMLRCTIPIPPWRAMAMARRDSVTVSMAAEASGMVRASFLAKIVVVSASPGSTDDLPGKSNTSSKVRPSEIGPSLIPASRIEIGRLEIGARKQRSPAGARWAGKTIHHIEKMRHRECLILRGIPIPVKLVISGLRYQEAKKRKKIIEVWPCRRPHPRLRK